ncbi:MBL fold metallo-hydrolase [Hymenobacter sp. CRA2]|uniref:MBL fold metallo-hydrolase n=1 Tax=Hymenobacter sp. CRA2 TaxID=1955620 RepID=UPI00098EC35D|nr:MBL fold metallo-hydrolase [Hymenobacter sp. CRA2]OON68548.1 hypothetical protein B0919_12975 [Hymenobacter sp. CRA2]
MLKFYAGDAEQFTILVDCGSCVRDGEKLRPYLNDLREYVGGQIDLLIVTHEHNDHVNGFDRCHNVFEGLTIKQAWFAWTENPNDPTGQAQELLNKRQKMRVGLRKALKQVRKNIRQNPPGRGRPLDAFMSGLDTLSFVNLDEGNNLSTKKKSDQELMGMKVIKDLLRRRGVETRYLHPGHSVALPELPGVNFHVLGPPLDKKYIYKNGKEGRDVYKRHFSIGDSLMALDSLLELNHELRDADLPFNPEFVLNEFDLDDTGIRHAPADWQRYLRQAKALVDRYHHPRCAWRSIEDEWLFAAGSLAIRLNSHINNTSLALGVELGAGGPVLLLPGDAEFGSWESWHMIEQWEGLGAGGKHLVEDLLNRTVFYKVAHHLSYNGTPLAKGVQMMTSPELAVMASLDLNRIAERWKSTMPNKELLAELMRRSQGRCFVMEDAALLSPSSDALAQSMPDRYCVKTDSDKRTLYKQYSVVL